MVWSGKRSAIALVDLAVRGAAMAMAKGTKVACLAALAVAAACRRGAEPSDSLLVAVDQRALPADGTSVAIVTVSGAGGPVEVSTTLGRLMGSDGEPASRAVIPGDGTLHLIGCDARFDPKCAGSASVGARRLEARGEASALVAFTCPEDARCTPPPPGYRPPPLVEASKPKPEEPRAFEEPALRDVLRDARGEVACARATLTAGDGVAGFPALEGSAWPERSALLGVVPVVRVGEIPPLELPAGAGVDIFSAFVPREHERWLTAALEEQHLEIRPPDADVPTVRATVSIPRITPGYGGLAPIALVDVALEARVQDGRLVWCGRRIWYERLDTLLGRDASERPWIGVDRSLGRLAARFARDRGVQR